ncbi:MAG: hypothetical protein ISR65_17535 [Bacteriovoracaceae bacterium]|nr:hypothetical protein [Bacteriovoracaceae bacterium]
MNDLFLRIFNKACEHIESSYIDRNFIQKKWQQIRDRYRNDLTMLDNISDFQKLMSELIDRELPLSHTKFITPEKRLEYSTIKSKEVPDHYKFFFEDNKHYLYLKIPSFSIPIFSIFPIVDAFKKATDNNRPIILDLRLNSGGSVSGNGQLLGYLLGSNHHFLTSKLANWRKRHQPHIIYPFVESQNDGNQLDVEACSTFPYIYWHTPKSVEFTVNNTCVLLIDKNTYSSGEIFAQSLKETERATLIGQTTYGAVVGAQDTYQCGMGYSLCLPFVAMESPQNYTIEGKGVTPDINYKFNKDCTENLDKEEILELLKL